MVDHYGQLNKCVDERKGEGKESEEIGHGVGGAPGAENEEELERLKKCRHLETCKNILSNIRRNYLTRKEAHLSFAWRELTRVRIILTEYVLPPNSLAGQIDACREEAYRLGLSKDPEIAEMLQRLAEAMNASGENKETEKQIKRWLKALLERFNSIRTSRISDQFLNIRAYTWAVVVLIALSVVLVVNHNVILGPDYMAAPGTSDSGGTANVKSAAQGLGKGSPACEDVLCHVEQWFVELLSENVLAFVYLAGLTGGFFSVAIRARGRARIPGDDAYVMRYLLTKPFVGALGAIIFFILFQGGLFQPEIMKALGKTPSPEVFGFAFLSGFSERIVFPEFK